MVFFGVLNVRDFTEIHPTKIDGFGMGKTLGCEILHFKETPSLSPVLIVKQTCITWSQMGAHSVQTTGCMGI